MSLNNILYHYWKQLHSKQKPPSMEQIISDDILEIWQHCFIMSIKMASNKLIYKYTHLGDEIVSAYKKELDPEHDSPPLVSSDPEILSGAFDEVMYYQNPIIEDKKILYSNSGIVKYDQCFLPLHSKDKNTYNIIGGMQYKIVS
ncbi:hypothetical protein CAXC1_220016 [Candidatus Xenohaliotis californiensis]|uniref:PAS domain-containing protein n=1 Tax=Candidatus Xenohaliotis californiensis TaxID=84677 RepID=A0ABP0ESG4_9RICK|nr:hypothetical protein CAXC1_220016 [Candidatus Xenohaliotis californiensis]